MNRPSERESISSFFKRRRRSLLPGIALVMGGIALFAFGPRMLYPYVEVAVAAPLVLIGMVALSVPIVIDYKTAPIPVVAIGTVLFVIGLIPLIYVVVTVI